MYKVIVRFIDLKDDNYLYNVGDVFPHDGKKVSDARIEELKSSKNKRKKPLIEEVVVKPAPEPIINEPEPAPVEEVKEEETPKKRATSRKKK